MLKIATLYVYAMIFITRNFIIQQVSNKIGINILGKLIYFMTDTNFITRAHITLQNVISHI